MSTAYERLIDALRDHGAVTDNGYGKAQAQCPSHDDGRPSLSVKAIDGSVLLHCFAGCQTGDVLAAVGLTMADLFDNPKGQTYDYPDGRRVHRSPDKRFRQSGNTKGTALYRADKLDATLDETVFVVEGEKDVLAIESAGGVAVCPAMGAGKAHKFDWTPLGGRTVIVVADKDDAGRKHAAQVAELLDGIAASVKVVEAATGKDAADHIAAGKTLADFADAHLPDEKKTDLTAEDSDEKPQRRPVAAQLVDMARAHYQLGITDADEPFGVSRDRPHIAMMLRGGKTGLRAELARRYFAETNTVASQQALADACMVLEGFAAQETPRPVYLRVAEHGGAVYIDMGDNSCRVIEISGGRWRIIDTAPVLFRRTKLTAALPHPHPGNLDPLWEFVPVAEDDQPVLLAFLVAALVQCDVPHPVLNLRAEHGSAKSSITRKLVDLTDPSPVALRKAPRDADGWVTAAASSWVVALDNLSGDIPGWLSDCLCRASTGDGDVRRALYTDGDVSVFSFRRVVIFNGVDVTVTAGDLADRLVSVELPRITEDDRREETELAQQWGQVRSHIFGALLDLAARVHERLPAVEVDKLPRMADFARVLAAVDEVLDTTGLARYRKQTQRAAADTLDVPFIAELVAAGRAFEDTTSAELLAAVRPGEPDWKPPRDWPKNARAVTGQLTRHAPALRTQGWSIDNDGGKNKACVTKWTITPPPQPEKGCNAALPDRPALPAQVNGLAAGREAGQGREQAGNRQGKAGNALSPALPENTSLTSNDRAAGKAGQETDQSLAACRHCATPIPESLRSARARGVCTHCTAKATANTGGTRQ